MSTKFCDGCGEVVKVTATGTAVVIRSPKGNYCSTECASRAVEGNDMERSVKPLSAIVWKGKIGGVEHRLVHVYAPVGTLRGDEYVIESSTRFDATGAPMWDRVGPQMSAKVAAEIAFFCYLDKPMVPSLQP